MSDEQVTSEQIREEVNAWLDENWNPDYTLLEWRETLVEGGWAMPHWPKEYYGRGFNNEQSAVVASVFRERSVVVLPEDGGWRLPAETILAMGSEYQKKRYLRPILTGQEYWCQLFSEPGSGSDLAGLTTKAEFIDGKWIINGQKVWNSGAHKADFGILVARTDFDVPKHQGIGYFLFNMRQPGVEVRPLKQMNGHATFNEVFFSDAEVPAEDLVAGERDGWSVAKVTLSYERRNNGVKLNVGNTEPETTGEGRCHEEYADYLKELNKPYSWYPQRQGRVDLVLPRARETGAINDPATRQEIAKVLSMKLGADLSSAALEAAKSAGSNQVIPVGSISKLAASVIARQANHVHTMISGADAMCSGEDSALDGTIAEILVSTPAPSIAGGTDEIQRNIVSERVLGMPKPARADTGPFRDIKRND